MDSLYSIYAIIISVYFALAVFVLWGVLYLKKHTQKKKSADIPREPDKETTIETTEKQLNNVRVQKADRHLSDNSYIKPTTVFDLDTSETRDPQVEVSEVITPDEHIQVKSDIVASIEGTVESQKANKPLCENTNIKPTTVFHLDTSKTRALQIEAFSKRMSGRIQDKNNQECSIEWAMQSEAISGGYCFVGGNDRTFYRTELTQREFTDGFYEDEIKDEKEIRQETALIEDFLPCKIDTESVIKVTSRNAPGIHFWANVTIEIGGYILKNPLIYTVSDMEYLKRKRFSFPWVKERLLLLSDIPADLKYQPHDYKALEEQEFGVNVLYFSLEQKAYYLDWLESCGNDGSWQFKEHCYSRHIDALWYRAFMEQKNLREITLRFFEFSYFESGERTNIKEMRRALCAYFLAIKQGISFNEDEKKILAYNFERYFMHYHYKYKSVWNFDPIGFLSSLGHRYLPSAICILEYYGCNASWWEFCAERDRRHFQYALAATAYIIKNYKFSFQNAGKLSTMETSRYGFKFSICYYGGISCTGVDLIAFIKEVCNSTDSLYRISFYGPYLNDFSWEEEYDAAFENLPKSIVDRTPLDNYPNMRKIKSLLALDNPSVLDILLTFESYDDTKSYFIEYEGSRLQLEEKRREIRAKQKSGNFDESDFMLMPSLKTRFIKKRIEKINEKIECINYKIVVNDFDEGIPLREVPVIIEKCKE